MTALRRHTHSFASRGLFLALALGTPPAVHGADSGQTFASPEEAVAALVAAASAHDLDAFRVIFGPASAEIQNPDQVQAANELDLFTAACGQHRQILRVSDARCVLEVGEDHWPFPIPLVQQEGRWFFDTEAGKEELLNRRIGRNEISTLQSVRAYVEAQREYAAKDRDDDEVLEYAPKFISSPGRKDGLHWPPGSDGEISPLGPLVAQAQHQGYAMRARNPGDAPEPFHGYFFRILIRQAASAPGGRYDYVINGNMIGGFALVAWPAEYGESGIMTFVVNQQGRVYQKDLGPGTEKSVRRLKAYAPDQTWVVSPD
jgi:hypothetical protein